MKIQAALFPAAAVLAAALACSFPGVADDDRVPANEKPPAPAETEMILGPISVHPSSGYGDFTLYLGYTPGDKNEDILCDARLNTGGNVHYLEKVAVPSKGSPGFTTNPQTRTISFFNADPGQYTMNCYTSGGKSVFTGFTVSDNQKMNPPPPEVYPGQPKKINGSGQGTVFSGDYSCSAAQDVLLVVKSDGAAELIVDGPMYDEYINCTRSASTIPMGWSITGKADFSTETVTFASCNSGGFNASGKVSYTGGVVNGTAKCIRIKGADTGKTAIYVEMP
jgi:hypothetical protein